MQYRLYQILKLNYHRKLFFDWLSDFLELIFLNKLEHFPDDLYNFHQTSVDLLEAVLYNV